MKKILPFNADIKMNGLPHYADFIGIITGHGYNDFNAGFDLIPIRYNPFTKTLEHATFALSSLRQNFMAKSIKEIPSDIISFIKEYIDHDFYLTIKFTVDVPNSYHNNLILGYDDETRTITFAGYWGNYKVWSISYEMLEKSLPPQMSKVYGFPITLKKSWYAFRFKNNYRQKKIRLWKVRLILLLYAYGKTPLLYNTTAIRSFVKNKLMKNRLDVQCTKKIEEHIYGILQLMQDIDPDCAETIELKALHKRMQTVLMRLAIYRTKKSYEGLEAQGNALIEISCEESRILKRFCRHMMKKQSNREKGT